MYFLALQITIFSTTCSIIPVAFAQISADDFFDIGEQIVSYDDSWYNTVGPTPSKRAEKEGYTAETHEVVTADGYILEVHRITGSKASPKADNKTAVLLMHGLLDCSATWVLGSPEHSLGFILADKGYDVWMGNVRGNRFARKHKWMTTKDREFWQFSWHEMGQFDLPAMIDKILHVTNQEKILYVGHSQGCTAFFAMASMKPEYQEKVEAMFALAPAVFIGNATIPLVNILAPIAREIAATLHLVGLQEFIPSPTLFEYVSHLVCSAGNYPQEVCASAVVFLLIPGETQLNETVVTEATLYDPAGTSIQNLLHFAQLANTGKFQQYDYGFIENLIRYGSISAPDYPLDKVKLPIYIYYASNDGFVDAKDIDVLYSKLSNVQKSWVPEPSFTHLDFVWAVSANTLVYNTVLDVMANQTTHQLLQINLNIYDEIEIYYKSNVNK